MREVDLRSEGVLDSPGDPGVAALAHRQHGVVSIAQLRAAGLAPGAVELRVRRGHLHLLHRGVYAVGHARVGVRGRLWAAVLACGGTDAAVLSHRSAAGVLELLPMPSGAIDVTTLRHSRSRPGIRVHRCQTLEVSDIAYDPDGLPLTSVARTLVDVTNVLTRHRLERACHRAEVLRLLDAAAVDALLARVPGRRTRTLRAALDTLALRDPDVTRSELEERLLEIVARAGLPHPAVNATVEGYEVDFCRRDKRVIVETDGAAAHLTRTAFERDRARDIALQVAGFRVLRMTWHRLAHELDELTASLSALFAASSDTASTARQRTRLPVGRRAGTLHAPSERGSD